MNARVIDDGIYDSRYFNTPSLYTGKRYEHPLPRDLRLVLDEDEGELEDQLANMLGWVIFSDRLISHLWPLIHDSVQVFPAPIFDPLTQKEVHGYQILNVIKVVDCIDVEYSVPQTDTDGRRRGFIEYCVDPGKAAGAHMFKYMDPPDHVDSGVTCSNFLAKHLAGRGFTGLAFLRCRERISR